MKKNELKQIIKEYIQELSEATTIKIGKTYKIKPNTGWRTSGHDGKANKWAGTFMFKVTNILKDGTTAQGIVTINGKVTSKRAWIDIKNLE